MRRVWIALAVLFPALLGFVAGYAVAFIIVIESEQNPECDGPCFLNPWPGRVGLGVGILCAVLVAFGAWKLINRYFIKPS